MWLGRSHGFIISWPVKGLNLIFLGDGPSDSERTVEVCTMKAFIPDSTVHCGLTRFNNFIKSILMFLFSKQSEINISGIWQLQYYQKSLYKCQFLMTLSWMLFYKGFSAVIQYLNNFYYFLNSQIKILTWRTAVSSTKTSSTYSSTTKAKQNSSNKKILGISRETATEKYTTPGRIISDSWTTSLKQSLKIQNGISPMRIFNILTRIMEKLS